MIVTASVYISLSRITIISLYHPRHTSNDQNAQACHPPPKPAVRPQLFRAASDGERLQRLHPLGLGKLEYGAGEEVTHVMIISGLEMRVFEPTNSMSAADVARIAPNHLRVVDAAPEVVDDAGAVESLGFETPPVVSAAVFAVVVPFALGVPIVGRPGGVPSGPVSEADATTRMRRQNGKSLVPIRISGLVSASISLGLSQGR